MLELFDGQDQISDGLERLLSSPVKTSVIQQDRKAQHEPGNGTKTPSSREEKAYGACFWPSVAALLYTRYGAR